MQLQEFREKENESPAGDRLARDEKCEDCNTNCGLILRRNCKYVLQLQKSLSFVSLSLLPGLQLSRLERTVSGINVVDRRRATVSGVIC